MMGGEIQKSSITHDTDYSTTAERTGKFASKHRVSTACVSVSTRTINKGGYRQKSHNSTTKSLGNTKAHPATYRNRKELNYDKTATPSTPPQKLRKSLISPNVHNN